MRTWTFFERIFIDLQVYVFFGFFSRTVGSRILRIKYLICIGSFLSYVKYAVAHIPRALRLDGVRRSNLGVIHRFRARTFVKFEIVRIISSVILRQSSKSLHAHSVKILKTIYRKVFIFIF